MSTVFDPKILHQQAYQDGQLFNAKDGRQVCIALSVIDVLSTWLMIKPAWAAVNVGTATEPVWKKTRVPPLRVSRNHAAWEIIEDVVVAIEAPALGTGFFVPKDHLWSLDPSEVEGLEV